jgi:hypothetical protein
MKVFINTVAFELPEGKRELTYEEIVRLAMYVGMPSVTFHWTEESPWFGGILHFGESVVCRDGTKIYVEHTGNA